MDGSVRYGHIVVQPSQYPVRGRSVWQIITSYRPHRNPRITGVLLLWMFGIFAVLWSPAPVPLTPEKLDAFQHKLDQIKVEMKGRVKADRQYADAELAVHEAKVWFWWFKPEHRVIVRKKQAVANKARAAVVDWNRKEKRMLSDAKKELGLWSEAGLEESRHLFWKSFEAGKVFGRRQTFWDTMINLLASRERNVVAMAIQLILTAAINFTAGMVCSVFVFLFQLPGFLASYQPSFLSGLLFFLVALTGAVSVVSAWLLGLYGASATAVYAVVAVANPQARLGGGGYRPIRAHAD